MFEKLEKIGGFSREIKDLLFYMVYRHSGILQTSFCYALLVTVQSYLKACPFILFNGKANVRVIMTHF